MSSKTRQRDNPPRPKSPRPRQVTQAKMIRAMNKRIRKTSPKR